MLAGGRSLGTNSFADRDNWLVYTIVGLKLSLFMFSVDFGAVCSGGSSGS